MNAKAIVQAWLDTPCEDPLTEADCLRLEQIIERKLAEAQAEIVQLKRLQLTSQDAAVVVGLRAERDALRAKLVQAREEAEAGKDLAGWAAAIKWNHRERNTEEWLAGLRERIEKVQALAALEGDKSGDV